MLLVVLLLWQTPAPACGDVADCRAQAQAARERGEFEWFHDLAWRAIQKGRPNDPDLMQLLARAQALSGRPADAIVMLGRLADLGVATDAATSQDFAVARLLPAWAALDATRTGKPAAAASAAPATPEPTPNPPLPSSSVPPPATLDFAAPGIEARGLAHDAVSRRFILGDRKAGRLLVIDEVSRRVVNYVSAASAGFYEDLTAFTVDARRGDLWVVSTMGEGNGSSSVLHKLQLVSGRGLLEARAGGSAPPLRLVDVTVTPDGVVYAIDAIDSRVVRLRPGTKTLEVVMRLETRRPTALAAADDHTLYVAAEAGLVRVDLASKSVMPVTSVDALTAFESLAWRAGTLLGVQRLAGSSLIVRIPLDGSGTRAQPRHVLAASPAATVGGLGGNAYYYLADDHTIRRLPLR